MKNDFNVDLIKSQVKEKISKYESIKVNLLKEIDETKKLQDELNVRLNFYKNELEKANNEIKHKKEKKVKEIKKDVIKQEVKEDSNHVKEKE